MLVHLSVCLFVCLSGAYGGLGQDSALHVLSSHSACARCEPPPFGLASSADHDVLVLVGDVISACASQSEVHPTLLLSGARLNNVSEVMHTRLCI